MRNTQLQSLVTYYLIIIINGNFQTKSVIQITLSKNEMDIMTFWLRVNIIGIYRT